MSDVCTNCGYKNTDVARFCSNCGKDLDRNQIDKLKNKYIILYYTKKMGIPHEEDVSEWINEVSNKYNAKVVSISSSYSVSVTASFRLTILLEKIIS
jgi:hypothetical protein